MYRLFVSFSAFFFLLNLSFGVEKGSSCVVISGTGLIWTFEPDTMMGIL
jgi:hypothetical protein